jgi:hypothetical protein
VLVTPLAVPFVVCVMFATPLAIPPSIGGAQVASPDPGATVDGDAMCDGSGSRSCGRDRGGFGWTCSIAAMASSASVSWQQGRPPRRAAARGSSLSVQHAWPPPPRCSSPPDSPTTTPS